MLEIPRIAPDQQAELVDVVAAGHRQSQLCLELSFHIALSLYDVVPVSSLNATHDVVSCTITLDVYENIA